MLIPARPGVRVLEVSEGDAFAAETLRASGCVVTCARESRDRAGAIEAAGFELRVVLDDAELARVEGAFDVVLLSIALGRTRGSERIVRDLRAIVHGAAARLAPGGRLVVLLPNPVYAFPLIAPMLDRLLSIDPGGTARGPLLPRSWSAGGLYRALAGAGLTDVDAFAALPGVGRAKFFVPLEGTAGAEVFFRTLVPRGRRVTRRAAVHLATVAASHRMLARLAPAFGVVASKAVAH